MNTGLDAAELELMRAALRRQMDVTGAILSGWRAKGCSRSSSDLDELALPYKFDVLALGAIRSETLLEHIRRVGVQ